MCKWAKEQVGGASEDAQNYNRCAESASLFSARVAELRAFPLLVARQTVGGEGHPPPRKQGPKTKKGEKANTSAYIRKCIFLQDDDPVSLKKELKTLSYQVRKIGVNINQVVAKINAGYGNQIDIYNLEKALEQVKHEMKTLNEKVEDYGNH